MPESYRAESPCIWLAHVPPRATRIGRHERPVVVDSALMSTDSAERLFMETEPQASTEGTPLRFP